MITRWGLIAALVAALALGGMLYRESLLRASAEAQAASLAASLAASEAAREQAREAARVADAHRKREVEERARLSAALEEILTGDIDDAPLDPRIPAFLECLRISGAGSDRCSLDDPAGTD